MEFIFVCLMFTYGLNFPDTFCGHFLLGSIVPRMPEEHRKSDMRSLIGQAAPLWVKDEDVSMCMLCASKFGLVHRRHHCRGCGWV